MKPKVPKRPLIMLTLNVAETYNKLIEQSQNQQKTKTNMTDEKGYFIAYENQLVTGYATEYTIKKALGQGSFGRVMLVEYRDGSNSQQYAALKICRAQPYFIDAMKQEIIIFKMITASYPQMTANFLEEFQVKEHLCYSMELFDLTLYQALKQTQGLGFDLNQIKVIARQFGKWLVEMQKLKIVHTDMKPENMVLNKTDISDIKLIDFGSGVLMDQPSRPTYIQSRFYRAPEITLGLRYDYKIDCWSIGALLFELHTCYTCFPARSSPMLMKMFVSLMGLPPRELIMNDEGVLRAKVEKYFAKATPEYWNDHAEKLKAVGLSQDSYIYLSEEVLDVEDRQQCFKRQLRDLMVNKQWEGTSGHTQEDYNNFFELINNLITWRTEDRWCGQQILQSAFCQ
ncbi:Kinase [Hexamita inflata]|uniref:Kinase n=1 Tax=Hexamita inflata TaxID=28002 RepID=A0ABP1GUD9_9EUKA